jgi:uncharacterized membrane protein YccC
MSSLVAQIARFNDRDRLRRAISAATPALIYGLRLWASVSLAMYLAFWLQLDNPYWAGTSAAIVCQPQLGASLRKGWYRMIGTLIGAVMIITLVACFPQNRVLFLGALALWGGAAALVATVLRNFASYSAALAGYTAAIIAGDLLGATGGVDANAAFLLAVARASEIIIGIVSAGVVLAGTDLGGARRRLAALFSSVLSEIMAGFTATLAGAGPNLPDTEATRHEFVRRVIALDPLVDAAMGESSQLRYHSPVLQRAIDGLFAALAGWRAVANYLRLRSDDAVQREAASVLESVPASLQAEAGQDQPMRWTDDAVDRYRTCAAALPGLIALPAETPSLRLLADQTANVLAGMAEALNGLTLLVADPVDRASRRGSVRVRVADWLPALVNAGRAAGTISAVALFWIVTTWPNGAWAITFSAIMVTLFAPRADQAYAAGVVFLAGTLFDVVLTATVAFAVFPWTGVETFVGFSLIIGLCLVPMGALLAAAKQPWQIALFTAMTMLFMPLLAPTNQESYDTVQFYNSTLAIVVGICFALLSFRLLPPLSPAYRVRRLLAVTLRDLRRLAKGRIDREWGDRIRGRLVAMPETATPLERAQLLAALPVGSDIIHLRDSAHRLKQLRGNELFDTELEAALDGLAHGKSVIAIAHLARLDEMLAGGSQSGPEDQRVLRTRASIIDLSATLTKHAAYFDAGLAR